MLLSVSSFVCLFILALFQSCGFFHSFVSVFERSHVSLFENFDSVWSERSLWWLCVYLLTGIKINTHSKLTHGHTLFLWNTYSLFWISLLTYSQCLLTVLFSWQFFREIVLHGGTVLRIVITTEIFPLKTIGSIINDTQNAILQMFPWSNLKVPFGF